MNAQLKAKMRVILLDRYGIDIDRAQCHFSTQNYAFIPPGEPFMIRVSITPKKTRSEILSELMWLDLTVIDSSEEVILRIRDNGSAFDPLAYDYGADSAGWHTVGEASDSAAVETDTENLHC